MSDTQNTTDQTGGAGNSTEGTTSTSKVDETLGEAGMSALRAERAANKDLKAELAQIKADLKKREDAELSELDKLKKKAADWEAKAKGYEKAKALDEIKVRVAEAFKVPADLLAGEDEASITAHGEKLAAALGPKTPQPNPFLNQGQNAGQAGNSDAEALAALGFGPA